MMCQAMLTWCRGEPRRLRLGCHGDICLSPEGEVDRIAMYDPLNVEADMQGIVHCIWYWACSVIVFFRV